MKRAQRFRLEDQRGTEINFELPDFLKDNNPSKWKNINTFPTEDMTSENVIENETHKKPSGKAPQPAPRLSINRNNSQNSCIESGSNSEALNENENKTHVLYSPFNPGIYYALEISVNCLPFYTKIFIFILIGSEHSDTSPQKYVGSLRSVEVPPPLPPKPKIKPCSWSGSSSLQLNDAKLDGNLLAHGIQNSVNASGQINGVLSAAKIVDKKLPQPRTIYFDRMNSSFV